MGEGLASGHSRGDARCLMHDASEGTSKRPPRAGAGEGCSGEEIRRMLSRPWAGSKKIAASSSLSERRAAAWAAS